MGITRKLAGRLARWTLIGSWALSAAAPALANPSGPTVRHGEVNYLPGNQALIQQLTDRAIVDWQSFSIDLGEAVRILQPGQYSVLLNRVTGGDASQILGTLQANGNVWLINPNGILFGPNSEVNVGGLVASSLNITDQDFLSQNYSFAADGANLGAVVNQGTITVTDGGYAVLTGPSVINEGTIVARAGNVVLGASERATLNLDGRDLIHFAVDQSLGEGTVLLAPGMMSDTLAQTFGVSSSRRANRLVEGEDGSFRLAAGTLVQAGTVSVDGREGVDGGRAVLDSSDLTILAAGSVTSASGQGENSNGGEVYVLSAMDGKQSAAGFTDVEEGASLLATGGTSGDGGFIEVSGDRLNLHGTFDLSAAQGEHGEFLLDPITVTIVDGNMAPTDMTNPVQLSQTTVIGDEWFETLTGLTSLTVESAGHIVFDIAPSDGDLDFSGSSVKVLTLRAGTNTDNEAGDIFLGDDGTLIVGLRSLTLETVNAAGGDIDLGDSEIQISGVSSAPLTILATGSLDMGSADIDVFTGNTSGNTTLLIDVDNDINFDTADFLFDFDGGSNRNVFTTILAGGSITGAPVDGDRSSYQNEIHVDGFTRIEADGAISLPDAEILIGDQNVTGVSLLMDSKGGGLDLSQSRVSVVQTGSGTAGATTFRSNGATDMSFLDLAASGDLTVDSEGSLTFVDATFNPLATTGQTGFLTLDAVGDINLGTSTFDVNTTGDANPLTIRATGSLNMGSADIDVIAGLTSGSTTLLIDVDNDINFDTADLLFDFDGGSNRNVFTTILAGGSITGAPVDGDRSSYQNEIHVDGFTRIEADGAISLPDAEILIGDQNVTGVSLLMDSKGGGLDLSQSRVSVVQTGSGTAGATTFRSNGATDMSFLDLAASGDLTVDSEGTLTFVDARFNPGATAGQTGFLTLDAVGDINLGSSTFDVNATAESDPLTILATGSLNMGSADIDVFTGSGSGNSTLLIDVDNDINLGTADLLYDFVGPTTRNVFTTILAGGSITGAPVDGDRSTYQNEIHVDGFTRIEADGVISLPDAEILIGDQNVTGVSLLMDSKGGGLDLSQSRVSVVQTGSGTAGATTFRSNGATDMSFLDLAASGDLTVDSEGTLTFVDARFNPGATAGQTGFLTLDAVGDINLGSSTFAVNATAESDPLTILATGSLNMGSADIDVSTGSSIGSSTLLIDVDNDINFDTADLLYDFVGPTTRNVFTTILAGGSITGAPVDGDGSTYQNEIHVDGFTSIEADGAISLPDAEILIGDQNVTGVSLLMDSKGGGLDLSQSRVSVVQTGSGTAGATTFRSNGATDMSFLDLAASGDLTVDSEGSLTFVDATFNPLATTGQTGFLTLDVVGDIDLGSSNFDVNTTGNANPLTIRATGSLNMGSADIDVIAGNTSGNTALLIDVDNDIDFGTADLLFDFDGGSNRNVFTTIEAGGSITSAGPISGDFQNQIYLDGATRIEALGGSLELFDADLLINEINTTGSSLAIRAETGDVSLGESKIETQNNVSIFANGVLDAGSSQFVIPNQISLGANTEVFANGSAIDASDIEIFGFTGGTIDYTRAVAGNVRLDLNRAASTDVSILADGDVDLTQAGGGTINLERAGFETPGTGNDPASIRSNTGSVRISSNGVVVVGSGGTIDTGSTELIAAAQDVRIEASEIQDRHAGGAAALDVSAGRSLELVAQTSIGAVGDPLEVQAPSLVVDVAAVPGATARVNLFGDSDFLQVIGHRSNIQVNENASGGSLTSQPSTDATLLTLDSTNIETIEFVDIGSIELNDLIVNAPQTVAVKALSGDISSGVTAPSNDVQLDGKLLLIAEGGSIGSQAESIKVSGGVLAANAAGNAYLQSTGDDLTIGQVDIVNTVTSTPIVSQSGVRAGQDVEISLPSTAQTVLRQQADISGSGVAIDLSNGDLVQENGVVRGDSMALRVGGSVGQYDGTDVLSEVEIEAGDLFLEIGDDAILRQANGDLRLVDQIAIGGETYAQATTDDVGGDLRTIVSDGTLTLETDLQVAGQTALVTGTNLVSAQTPLPNSMFLNGSITSGQDLVLLSQGDIIHLSGTLTAPRIGLGANGTIGSSANPVQVVTNEMAVNPFEAQVVDPDGFTVVDSVTAVGVTVNQGAPVPPDPEPPIPPVVPPVVPPGIPPSVFQPPVDIAETELSSEIFSQDNTEMVEEVLEILLETETLIEYDPTLPPVLDEDLLNRKRRDS